MKKLLQILVCALFASVMFCACEKDENGNAKVAGVKIDSSELQSNLQAKIDECKKFIEEEKAEAKKIADEIKNLSAQDLLNGNAAELKAKLEKINQAIKDATEKLNAYVKQQQEALAAAKK